MLDLLEQLLILLLDVGGRPTKPATLRAMALGALIAMPLGGAAIARMGSATVMRASTITWCAAFMLPILAPNPLLLIAALLVFGAALRYRLTAE